MEYNTASSKNALITLCSWNGAGQFLAYALSFGPIPQTAKLLLHLVYNTLQSGTFIRKYDLY